MTTEILLLIGMMGAVVFAAVLLIEGAIRPGYNPNYHTGSELELGSRGWIQRSSFLLMGVGVFAFAVGIQQATDSIIGALLLTVFGFGMIIAGVFPPDPVRGYPPDAPTDPSSKPTFQAQIHHVVSGPIAFLAMFGACLTLAGPLEGGWGLYTVLTAAVGLAMTALTAFAFWTDAANTGLVQRGLLLVYWSWIVAIGAYLITDPPHA